jgi:HAD superfamily hydrolase (TIGR01509 family)
MKPVTRQIEALLFDFDGLIVETEEPIFVSWQNLYTSFGLELPLDLWLGTIGSSDAEWDPVVDLKQKLDRALDWNSLLEKRRQTELDMVEKQPVLPGVIDYLESARRVGLKTGVASSSSRRWVEGHLKRTGLMGYFDCIRTSDDVRQTKPNPELFLTAIQVLQVEPQRTLVFEDSANGILAAKRAGAWCVAVPNQMTIRQSLDLADLRLESLAEMPLEALLEKIQNLPA